uniref:Uncharacterized protein n=1 Tax=Riptortus pedestris TaxID=329032 RepID=R4WTC4_RIPPE|nr:conserved hypothetical protein [Riptortus pedestris]
MSANEDALEWKEKGNECVRNGKFEEAIMHYTAAIKSDPRNPTLYSNRSLAFLKSKQHYYAFMDARETIKLRPDWAKGYFRKGEVEMSAGRAGDALFSYGLAKRLQPNDSSISAALSKAEEAYNKEKRREQVPWLCAGIGIITGVIIIMCDQLLTKTPSTSHPLLMAFITIAISALGYGLARAWKYHVESQAKSLLEPPVDLIPEMNGHNPPSESQNETTEKNHSRFTKAQARAKLRKGKT